MLQLKIPRPTRPRPNSSVREAAPRGYFDSARHYTHIAETIRNTILRMPGHILLTGASPPDAPLLAGSLQTASRSDLVVGTMSAHPQMDVSDFLCAAAATLGIERIASSRNQLWPLASHLMLETRKGKCHVLVIENAASLSDAILDQIHHLATIDQPRILNAVLLSTPFLVERLSAGKHEPFQSAVTARIAVERLLPGEIASYIGHEFGADEHYRGDLFTPSLESIAAAAGGDATTVDNIVRGILDQARRVAAGAAAERHGTPESISSRTEMKGEERSDEQASRQTRRLEEITFPTLGDLEGELRKLARHRAARREAVERQFEATRPGPTHSGWSRKQIGLAAATALLMSSLAGVVTLEAIINGHDRVDLPFGTLEERAALVAELSKVSEPSRRAVESAPMSNADASAATDAETLAEIPAVDAAARTPAAASATPPEPTTDILAGPRAGELQATAAIVGESTDAAPLAPAPEASTRVADTPPIADDLAMPVVPERASATAAEGKRLSPSDTAGLVKRGFELLRLADIGSARLFFERAADVGDMRAANGLGQSYDPQVLRHLNVRGIAADEAEAIKWYQKAVAGGDETARSRLDALRAQTVRKGGAAP